MPDMFNPASYEWTANENGNSDSVIALVILYFLGLIVTIVSFEQSNLDLKGVMPWITLPILAPIDLLAAF